MLDSGIALERQRGEELPLADRADDGRLAAGRHVRRATRFLEPLDDVLDLVGRRLRAHHDQELGGADDGHASV